LDKVFTLIGFAMRAGKVVRSYTGVEKGTLQRKIKLILADESLSENTTKKLLQLSKNSGIPFYAIGPAERLGRQIGKENTKIIGITDKQFAEKMEEQMNAHKGGSAVE
jgi:ribosomal protein L7Ae-like RNA K-turn-binding protein